MLIISIDGACRRNGKPTCVSSGGLFIQQYNDDTNKLVSSQILAEYEIQSTNQRGEMIALLIALSHVYSAKQPTQIITDSEYLFNAMTKQWYKGWMCRNWMTAINEPVKNSDIWREIIHAYDKCIVAGIEIVFYHIKGHCIPFGKVTATSLLKSDTTGQALYKEVCKKFDQVSNTSRAENIAAANELSVKNNGFELTQEIMKRFVVANVMADAIATMCVEAADSLMD